MSQIEDQVKIIIDQRAKFGFEKYDGITMERDDISLAGWIQHLQNELLDAAIYAEKLKAIQGNDFAKTFNDMQTAVHNTALEKGWWEKDRSGGELIALIHLEVSEALEAIRVGNPPSQKLDGKFTQAEEELADVIVRIMDMAEYHGWNIAGAVLAKAEYNKTRPHRHGGKLL
jgi:NTP pyrophosphatase (non-canonical NTP hydrolase)